MKKVVFGKREEKVCLSYLNDDSIIGSKSLHRGHKFILSATRNSGFEWIGSVNLSSSSKVQYKNIKEACEDTGDVYVFETTKELFKWMSE